MSRLTVPITGKTLWTTGDVRLWTDLDLLLKDNVGQWPKQSFRVDTASDLTTFPAYLARQLDVPMPRRANPGARHTQTGLEIRSGILRFQVLGMDPTEYAVACLFLGDPDTPPDASSPATFPRTLLQPYQLAGQLRFVIEKDPSLGCAYGELVIEKV
jgi:hypothetical protein